MFDNIGNKIKVLAKVLTWVGIIASIIAGVLSIVAGGQWDQNNPMILPGVLTIVGGSLAAWIGSFLLYGFGELIDQTMDINRRLQQRSPEYRSPGGDGQAYTTQLNTSGFGAKPGPQ